MSDFLLRAPGRSQRPGLFTPKRGQRWGSAARMLLLVVAASVAFAALQVPERHLEALIIDGAIRLIGFHGLDVVNASSILISPPSGALFWVDITSSCSAFGPVLALGIIAWVISTGRPLRERLAAAAAGMVTIYLGNLLRMGSSVVVGLVVGRVSLVLFHDWVGSIFGFLYTVAGFIVTVSVLLGRPGSSPASQL